MLHRAYVPEDDLIRFGAKRRTKPGNNPIDMVVVFPCQATPIVSTYKHGWVLVHHCAAPNRWRKNCNKNKSTLLVLRDRLAHTRPLSQEKVIVCLDCRHVALKGPLAWGVIQLAHHAVDFRHRDAWVLERDGEHGNVVPDVWAHSSFSMSPGP